MLMAASSISPTRIGRSGMRAPHHHPEGGMGGPPASKVPLDTGGGGGGGGGQRRPFPPSFPPSNAITDPYITRAPASHSSVSYLPAKPMANASIRVRVEKLALDDSGFGIATNCDSRSSRAPGKQGSCVTARNKHAIPNPWLGSAV